MKRHRRTHTGEKALPLWSMRPAVPLLQHAKSPPREVFPGQEPSPAGLLCYNQSTQELPVGMETLRDISPRLHGVVSFPSSMLHSVDGGPSHSQLRSLTPLYSAGRADSREPVTTALYYTIVSLWCRDTFYVAKSLRFHVSLCCFHIIFSNIPSVPISNVDGVLRAM